MKNFTKADLGALEDLDRHLYLHPKLGKKVPGKVFLKALLGLTGMEASLGKLSRGRAVPFRHKHRQNEELYIVLRGRGQFEVDGEIIEAKEGTVIRVAPEGVRTWRAGADEDLYYLCIQAKAGSEPAAEIADSEYV